MLDYATLPGYGDTFFQYGYNANALTNGQSYQRQFINIANYDFICRHWAGWETVIDPTTGTIQAYDDINRDWAALPMNLGAFTQGQVVLPEKRYRVNSRIQFDLVNVLKAATGGNTASQLVFTGVRRIPGISDDPAPSDYTYYRKSFAYPYSLTVQQTPTADQLITIPINDFDFELERVELAPYTAVSPFSITLFDTNNFARSNVAINANRFFHFDPALSNGELNFWPCPPVLYKVNSSLRFNITSLLAAGPVTYRLLFVGSRRIPCG